jgi:hypothetical protein
LLLARDAVSPQTGDVVIWDLTLAGRGLSSYLLFKLGGTDPPRHFEGAHIWGKVFTEAKCYADRRAVWLREGVAKPRRLIEPT